MSKQMSLDLCADRFALLWRRLPERARRAVIEQYAHLIARMAQLNPNSRETTQGTKTP